MRKIINNQASITKNNQITKPQTPNGFRTFGFNNLYIPDYWNLVVGYSKSEGFCS